MPDSPDSGQIWVPPPPPGANPSDQHSNGEMRGVGSRAPTDQHDANGKYDPDLADADAPPKAHAYDTEKEWTKIKAKVLVVVRCFVSSTS